MLRTTRVCLGLLLSGLMTISAPSAFGTSQSGASDGQFSLKWKFREGDTFYAMENTTMQQNMSLMGQDIQLKMKTQTVTRFRIKEVKKDATVVEMTILQQKMQTEGPMGGPGGDLGEKLKNVTFTFTVNDKMEVVKFEGYDKFLDAISSEDPMMAAFLRSILQESVIKQSFGRTFSLAPDKPLSVGQTWQHKDKLPLGPIGTIEVNSRYKLEGVTDSLARLSISGDLKWTGNDGKMDQALPFKFSEVNIKADKFTGTALFDLQKGRLSNSQMDIDIKGSLVVEVGGQKVDMDIKQQMRTEMKVVDKNPLVD